MDRFYITWVNICIHVKSHSRELKSSSPIRKWPRRNRAEIVPNIMALLKVVKMAVERQCRAYIKKKIAKYEELGSFRK